MPHAPLPRVYDANGEAAIDDTENIRIAYIEVVPPGTSPVSFKLFVPQEQFDLGPLKLVGFKVGRPGGFGTGCLKQLCTSGWCLVVA